jgi:hypothetical protein
MSLSYHLIYEFHHQRLALLRGNAIIHYYPSNWNGLMLKAEAEVPLTRPSISGMKKAQEASCVSEKLSWKKLLPFSTYFHQ